MNPRICLCCGKRLSEDPKACCVDPNVCASCSSMSEATQQPEHQSAGGPSGPASDKRCALKIICPVVVGLNRDAQGKVIIGRSTQMACDLAISIAKEDPRHSIIITPGGCAGKEWDHAWAGGLMGNYIKARTEARVLRQVANTFDTSGELSLVAYTVHHMSRRQKCFSEIVLIVKTRDASQTAFLCRQLLNELNLPHIRVSTRTYELPAGWRASAREYFGAWPRNLIRLLLTWAMNYTVVAGPTGLCRRDRSSTANRVTAE